MNINPPAPVEHPIKKQRRRSGVSKKAKGGRKRNLAGANVEVFCVLLFFWQLQQRPVPAHT